MKRYLDTVVCLAALLSLSACVEQGQQSASIASHVVTPSPFIEQSGIERNHNDKAENPVKDDLSSFDLPVHSEPLATDWGRDYKMGELVLNDGCLRILEDPDLSDHDDFVPFFLPIWPEGFSWARTETSVVIVNASGKEVARVGDYVRVSGDGVYSENPWGEQIKDTLSPACASTPSIYYLVGDDATVVGADEPELVSVADSDIYIRRQKTKERGFTPIPDTADGYGYALEPLEVENGCVVLLSSAGSRYVPIWPAGFTGHIENGVLEVRNGGGRTIARIGERLRIRGSIVDEYLGGVVVPECDARLLRVKQIINADLPLAFLKHDSRWKSETEQEDKLRGGIDVHNGCMHINYHFLLWPSDYLVEETGDLFKVLDASGTVVAQRAERAILKGYRIKADDKSWIEIKRTMPIDCPAWIYWIVTGYE